MGDAENPLKSRQNILKTDLIMEEWGVIGFFVLLFAPTLGRLHWLAGVVTIAAGILVMLLAGGDSVGALGISGLVCIASSYVHNKTTGDIEIVDIFSYIAGIVLIILAFVSFSQSFM